MSDGRLLHIASEIVGRHFENFYTPVDRAAGVPRGALETAVREGKFEAEGSKASEVRVPRPEVPGCAAAESTGFAAAGTFGSVISLWRWPARGGWPAGALPRPLSWC